MPGDSTRTHTRIRSKELFLSKGLTAIKGHRCIFTWSGQRAKQKSGVMFHGLVLMSTQ